MTELFSFVNSASPLAVIALLSYVVYLLVRNKRSVHAIATNHLHNLPEMGEAMKRVETAITDQTAKQAEQHTAVMVELTHIKARLK